MVTKTADDILQELNTADEHVNLEAKTGFSKSALETISAFSNEPNSGGGTLIIGVAADGDTLPRTYKVVGVDDPDKISAEIATQMANKFNTPLRLAVRTEILAGKPVIVIDVPEASLSDKPVYIQNTGLPRGAFRRIGSTDQRCNEEDLAVLYNESSYETFDNHIIPDAAMDDIDPEAVAHYRRLRQGVSPDAEEHYWQDQELLQALSAIRRNKAGQWQPTLTGVLLFGSRQALRRLVPSVRVDYIRLPGREWIEDPENRYEVMEMRAPLLPLVHRVREAVYDDLPKAFSLPEGEMQAQYKRQLPERALREAIVNALMHSSYRLHQPIQIRRYSNRIEIYNPGYSLKNEELLGEPGSQLRNPKLAAVFHDTNLAEQKGSGIRTMGRLMEEANFAPPTFTSDRENNSFTAKFLLHHFLNDQDLEWLKAFESLSLNQEQRKGLIFLRENGAIDNNSYRQINGLDTLKASNDLRRMRDLELIEMRDKGKAAYYLPGARMKELGENDQELGENEQELGENDRELGENEQDLGEKVRGALPGELQERIENLPKKAPKQQRQELLTEICKYGTWTAKELAELMNLKDQKYLKREYLHELLEQGKIAYQYPDMSNHPQQAYSKPTKKTRKR